MNKSRCRFDSARKVAESVLVFLITVTACGPTPVPATTVEPTTPPATEPANLGVEKCIQFDRLGLGSLTSPLILDWLTVTPTSGSLRAVDFLPPTGDSISELSIDDGLALTHARASAVVVRAAHFNTPIHVDAFTASGQYIRSAISSAAQAVVHELDISGGASAGAVSRVEIGTDEREGSLVEYCATLLPGGWQYETTLAGLNPITESGYPDLQGDMVIAGTLADLNRNERTWIIRADYAGVPKWHKLYIGIKIYGKRRQVILRMPNGDSALIGVVFREEDNLPPNDRTALGVVRINPRGNVEWSIGVEMGQNDLWGVGGHSGHVTSDGGLILAAAPDYLNPELGQRLWIGKLSPEGNMEWNKTYSINPTLRVFAVDITQSADGGYIFAGRFGGLEFDQGEVLVIRLDASGNILWQKVFGGGPPNNVDGAENVIETRDGHIVVAGFTESFGPDAAPGKQYFLVLMLDANGNIVWGRAIGNPDMNSSSMAYFIEETESGALLVSGEHFPSQPDGLVVKLDQSGSLLWARVYSRRDAGVGEPGAVGFILHARKTDGDELVVSAPSCSRDAPIAIAWTDSSGVVDSACIETVEQIPGIFNYLAPVTASDASAVAHDGGATVMPVDIIVSDETATQVECGCQ